MIRSNYMLFYITIACLLISHLCKGTGHKLRVAGFFNYIQEDPDTGVITPHKRGPQILQAFVMAINELNNQTDGQYDDLLPAGTVINFAVAEEDNVYTDEIERNIKLHTTAFGNSSISTYFNTSKPSGITQPRLHGVIGGLSNTASDAIAKVTNKFKTVQVAYGSTGSYLSYIQPYPYYLRTVKDDAYEGVALAQILSLKYKWSHISVFSTTSSYGADLSTQFQKTVLNSGITIVNTYSYRALTKDLSIYIDDAISSGARIFVLLMEGWDIANLVSQGYKRGLFKEKIQIVCSSALQESIVDIEDDVPVQEVLKGALSLQLSDAYKSSQKFKDWVKRWRAQPDTVNSTNSGQSITCDFTKDKNYPPNLQNYLYLKEVKDVNNNDVNICTGLQFGNFAEDGSDIDTLAPYAYDAVISLFTGIGQALKAGADIDDVETSGDIIGLVYAASTFVANGITGPIAFSQGDETGYGYGDRELGTQFLLVNFQPNEYCPSSKTGGFVNVAVWDKFSTPPIKDLPSDAIVYNTPDNSLPLAVPAPIIVGTTPALSALLVVFAAIAFLMIFSSFFLLFYYRENKIVKMSQPIMIILTLIGSSASALRVLWGGFDFTPATCAGNLWFGHVGFIIFNTTLIIKTWRVHLIVNNTSVRKVKISTSQALFITMGVIIAFLIYIAIIQGLGNTRVEYIVEYLGKLQYKKYPICVNDMTSMTTALYILEAALIAQGGRLCYLTRNVPDSVNDSKAIATATYTIIFLSCIIGPIIWLIQLDPYIANFLVGIGFAIGSISGLALLLGNKFFMVIRGATVDSKLNIVYKNSVTGKKIVANDTAIDPALTPNDTDASKLKVGKTFAEENSTVCKVQSKKWSTWLQFYESQILFESVTNSSSNQSQNSNTSHTKPEYYKNDVLLTDGTQAHAELYTRTEEA